MLQSHLHFKWPVKRWPWHNLQWTNLSQTVLPQLQEKKKSYSHSFFLASSYKTKMNNLVYYLDRISPNPNVEFSMQRVITSISFNSLHLGNSHLNVNRFFSFWEIWKKTPTTQTHKALQNFPYRKTWIRSLFYYISSQTGSESNLDKALL